MRTIISIVGKSGSGKTTLLERLITELKARGHKIAIVKHSHHTSDIDTADKDIWRFTKAGSELSALNSLDHLAIYRRMDDYFVFDGGFARLPEGSSIDFVGMPGGTLAYGCLSEALLLAFDRRNASFARGPLSVSQVLETMRLAEQYGFTLGGVDRMLYRGTENSSDTALFWYFIF